MAEEKMYCGGCGCKKYAFFGTLAIVYGITIYMIDVMGWAPYMAWILGGVIFWLVGWAKGSMKS
jgi:hypothetical protein